MADKTRADIVAALRKNGFSRDDIAELEACENDSERRAWFDRKGIEFENVDAVKAWHNTKTVLIEATEGEDVQIVEPEGEAPEGEEAFDDEDERQAPEPERSARRRENAQKYVRKSAEVSGRAPAVRSQRERKRLAYQKAADQGSEYGVGRYRGKALWDHADIAEAWGAVARLKTMARTEGYAQKSNDLDIMQKFLGTTDLTEGGAFVADEFSATLTENFSTFGVARRLAGVEAMASDTKLMPRHTDDVTVALATEGTAQDESNPKQDLIQLVAQKALGRSKASNEILNESAIDIASYMASTHRRAIDRFVDQAYLLGQHGFNGVLDGQRTENTFDAALSSNWNDMTISDLMSLKGTLPAWALEDISDIAYVAHPSFIASTFERFELNNGGVARAGLREGFPNELMFGGIPIVPSAVMPNSYTADEIQAFAGAFGRGTKYGEVTGSFEIQASDQEEFSNDLVVFRSRLRFAISVHDVGIDRDESGDGTATNQDAIAYLKV